MVLPAHATTPVAVRVLCHDTAQTGGVHLTGTLNVCPLVDGLSASPAEVFVGGSIALSASAHDSDAAPSPLSYAWTSSGGSFSDAKAQSPRFDCTLAGPVTITATVSDGSCSDTGTLTVTCDLPACDDGNPCTTDGKDAAGACTHAPARSRDLAVGETGHGNRNAIGHPVADAAGRTAFRIEHQQRIALGALGRISPGQRRRNVLADAIRIGLVVAGVLHRQPLAVLEARRRQREYALRFCLVRTAKR